MEHVSLREFHLVSDKGGAEYNADDKGAEYVRIFQVNEYSEADGGQN